MKTLAELKAQVAELQEQIRKLEEERHSPGPWRISVNDAIGGIWVDDSRGRLVVHVLPEENCAANARLIKKAPELLEVAVAVAEGSPRAARSRELVEYIAPHLLVKP